MSVHMSTVIRPWTAEANMANISKRTINHFVINANFPVVGENSAIHHHFLNTKNPVNAKLR
ncbi:hypothetical protein LOAG_18913, partial [Loa loa]